jgi:tetratricopeptide (TPR) repeat protein
VKRKILILLILISSIGGYSQNPKRSYKNGVKEYEAGKYQEALGFFNHAIQADTTFVDAYIYRAKIYEKNNNLQLAAENYEMATILSPNVVDYFLETGRFYYKIKNYEKALYYLSESLILDKENFQAYQLESFAYIKIKMYKEAIVSANNALQISEDFKEFYVKGVANDSLKKYYQAIANYKKTISLNEKFKKVYVSLSGVYLKIKEYDKAVENANNTVKRFPDYPDAYKIRSLIYYKTGKVPSAINDLSKLDILVDDPQILLTKGRYYFESNLFLNAKSDFTQLIASSNKNYEALYWRGRANEELMENKLAIKDYRNYITIVRKDSAKGLNISDAERRLYYLNKEKNPPILSILSPIIQNNKIQTSFNNDSLYIKGKIKDENNLKYFIINDDSVTLNSDNTFTYSLNITDVDNIKIKVADIYDNTTRKLYYIEKKSVIVSKTNPMGKTWVVFIENSDYDMFTSIDGPQKDVKLIKEALSDYEIHNFIHKKNMTKQEMERFFSIELRDLIKKDTINSLLIWYAGHGNFINETGYWIPSDGNPNDEFTYFNINTLKANILMYMSYLKHILVVTDACKTGPSFYMAMRSTKEAKLCNDKKATEFKSAQVFSSAGYELASDNSMFTKIFAKTLIYNNNICIPIDFIVKTISESTELQKQKPLFGKILGVDDENGTFFFVKKE